MGLDDHVDWAGQCLKRGAHRLGVALEQYVRRLARLDLGPRAHLRASLGHPVRRFGNIPLP